MADASLLYLDVESEVERKEILLLEKSDKIREEI